MMLDLALGLNALIWFAALMFPAFGFVKGAHDQRADLMRAQIIILSLLGLLLTTIWMLWAVAKPQDAEKVGALMKYTVWLIGILAVSFGLGWGFFSLVRRRVGLKDKT